MAVIYLGGWALGILVALVAAGGAHEFYEMSRKVGAAPFGRLGMLGAGALVLVIAVRPDWGWASGWAAGICVLMALLSLAWAVKDRGTDGVPLNSVTATTFGVLYCGATLACVLLIRGLEWVGTTDVAWAGTALVIFPLVITWVGDSSAYFGGRFFGKRPLAPKISPKKTIEGGLSGLLGSVVSAMLYAGLAFPAASVPTMHLGIAAAMGLVLGAVGQVGDLAESLLKREAGVKDSGTLLPGHGGLLDRFDAIFFTVPLCYGMYTLWLMS